MDERAVTKMLGIETAAIAGGSIIAGMVVGGLFGRLVQLVVIRLVDIDNVSYRLSPLNFIITFVVFAVIYLMCFMITDRKLRHEDISSLMKESRKSENSGYSTKNMVLAIIGLVSMIFAAVFILNTALDNHINSKLWVLIIFLGTGYAGLMLLVCNGGKMIVWLLRRRKNYYNSMLTVSEISHKYQQNVKVIIILSLLASMIVLLVGSPFALISMTEDLAESTCNDIVYMTSGDISSEAIDKLLLDKEVDSRDEAEVAVIKCGDGVTRPVISASMYNEQMNETISVNDGQVYNVITTWEPGNHGYLAGDQYLLGENSFTVCDSVKGTWVYSGVFASDTLLVLSDGDYASFEALAGHAAVGNIMFADGWRDTGDIVQAIRAYIGSDGRVNSRIDTYKNLKSGYSIFLFVASSMCIMFFISTGFVLYFKQYSELDEERVQYRKLFKLGINDRAVSKNIGIKLGVVYFTPLLGTIMGLLIMYYMANLFGGQEIIGTFMKKGGYGTGGIRGITAGVLCGT